MRKEDIIKVLMIYNNNFTTKFQNSLRKLHKEELEKELNNINKEVFLSRFDEQAKEVYRDLMYARFLRDEFKKLDLSENIYSLIETDYSNWRFLREEVIEFLEQFLQDLTP